MRVKFLTLACNALLLAVSASPGLADPWAEWRDPTRNGLAPQSPPLAAEWSKTGPALLWRTDAIPSATLGGYGSPSIAHGKVYVYVNWKTQTPVPQRRFTERALRSSEYSSPIIADGKLIAVRDNGRYLALLQATPDKYLELAGVPLPITSFTSPTFSDGKVVLRMTNDLACYDLTAAANPTLPADPVAKQAGAAIKKGQ